MNEAEIRRILEKVLFEFPVREIGVELPKWLTSLDKNHPIRKNIFDSIRDAASSASKISQVSAMTGSIIACEYVDNARLSAVELGKGSATICVSIKPGLFYQVLGETTGIPIADEAALMANMMELADIKKKYDKIRNAMDEVEATGYGIVMPELEEMTLEEPEIIKQSGRYGIRLKAEAPSIHMMKANITTEVSPIVGSEKQSEELVSYLLREFEEDPSKIWESNIFGTSLYGLVNEGLHNKLYRMPTDARIKLKETVERPDLHHRIKASDKERNDVYASRQTEPGAGAGAAQAAPLQTGFPAINRRIPADCGAEHLLRGGATGGAGDAAGGGKRFRAASGQLQRVYHEQLHPLHLRRTL